MTKLEVETIINKPKDFIWQIVTDSDQRHNWMPTHIAISSNPDYLTVGTTSTSDIYRISYGETTSISKRTTTSEIVDYEIGQSITTKLTDGLGSMKSMLRTWTLTIEPNGTKIVVEIDYQMKGGRIGKLAGALLAKNVMKKEIAENLSNLKHYAETGQSIPKPEWMLTSKAYKDSKYE